MSGVLIRCQHCGTTQAAPGECEACHEGDTRYYCPNHTPGRWLDAPNCTVCGARVGVSPKPAPSSPPPTRPPSPPRARRVEPRAPSPPRAREAPPPPPRYREPIREEAEATPVDPWRGGGAVRPRDVLEELLRMSRRGGGLTLPTAPAGRSGGAGCLRRLFMLVIMLVVLAYLAFYALFGVGGYLYGLMDEPPARAGMMLLAELLPQELNRLGPRA